MIYTEKQQNESKFGRTVVQTCRVRVDRASGTIRRREGKKGNPPETKVPLIMDGNNYAREEINEGAASDASAFHDLAKGKQSGENLERRRRMDDSNRPEGLPFQTRGLRRDAGHIYESAREMTRTRTTAQHERRRTWASRATRTVLHSSTRIHTRESAHRSV